MATITDVAVTGTKILTPGGDLVSLTKIRIEKIGTSYRVYGARLKNIVGGDAKGGVTDSTMSTTDTELVSVPGGFIISAADALLLEAALDSALEG
jgi:hypothetical protein